MGKSRRKHSREFKLEAVKQVVEHGRPVSEVADSLGVNRNMLSAWKRVFEAEAALAFPGQGKQNEFEEENRRLRRELAIARQEREILKKGGGLLRERQELKFQFVGDHREIFEVGLMCKTLEVSRSGFYAWLGRPESDRAREDRRLTALIGDIVDESRRTYGSPRVHRTLRGRGVHCGRKRVARLMRAAGLRAKTRRKFRVKTTDSKHGHPIAPDLLRRDFTAERPNRAWVSDITYIPTDEGWLYLASTMDLFSRMIVGWSMSSTLKTAIVVDALEMAIHRRAPEAGLVHHSDRGVQYASVEFRALLAAHGFQASMSRTGNCYDNAAKESFFHTLKTELVHHERYRTRDDARASVFEYIEAFYNRQRLHSTLGYMSPDEFERARTNAA
ncbi:MAG: IS3 family transposase [Planctomycetes bacterium]|nr:IS3 family transposase [Planctomycetota bacterium]